MRCVTMYCEQQSPGTQRFVWAYQESCVRGRLHIHLRLDGEPIAEHGDELGIKSERRS